MSRVQCSKQFDVHPVLLLVGDGRHPAWAPAPAVRDREAAALAGGGGADLRSKLGGPPILESWRAPMPKRSEEHTSELQSLMRISSADFCLKKNKPLYKSDMTVYRQKHNTKQEKQMN